MTGDSRYKDALEEARARGKEVTTMDALIDFDLFDSFGKVNLIVL